MNCLCPEASSESCGPVRLRRCQKRGVVRRSILSAFRETLSYCKSTVPNSEQFKSNDWNKLVTNTPANGVALCTGELSWRHVRTVEMDDAPTPANASATAGQDDVAVAAVT